MHAGLRVDGPIIYSKKGQDKGHQGFAKGHPAQGPTPATTIGGHSSADGPIFLEKQQDNKGGQGFGKGCPAQGPPPATPPWGHSSDSKGSNSMSEDNRFDECVWSAFKDMAMTQCADHLDIANAKGCSKGYDEYEWLAFKDVAMTQFAHHLDVAHGKGDRKGYGKGLSKCKNGKNLDGIPITIPY